MTLSEQLKRIRLECQLTQKDVAKQLYVTRQTVSRWENGATLPPLTALYDLAALYQLSLSELLGDRIIMTKKLNVMALFGSLVFNFFFLSTIGITFAAFWVTAWIIELSFMVSPVLVIAGILVGAPATGFHPIISSLVLFTISAALLVPLMKLSKFLYHITVRYFRYTFSTVIYTTVEK